jgi:hypothetical protein
MDTIAAQLTGDRKQAAEKHLQMSKDAFAKGDTQGCLQHMQETHLAMGLSESGKTGKTGAAEGATGGGTSGSY